MSVDLEELGRRAKEVEPAWDDLREQRLLESIRQAPPPAAPSARRSWFGLALAALVLLSVAVGLYAGGALTTEPPVADRSRPPEQPAPAEPEPGSEEGSEMVLADGSTITLGVDARVRLERQEPQRVVVAQERGRAVYSVRSMPARAFEVRTEAATVRVRGTVFVVDVGDEGTRVEVQEGRVEVEANADEGRRALLGAGDAFSVAVARSSAPPSDPPAPPAAAQVPPAGPEPARAATPPSRAVAPPSPDELLERADEARRAGEAGVAAEALGAFLERYGSDGRAASAAFTLGRVENRRGRHRAAARAFARTHQLAPAGPLAEDALAQEALAWAAAGERDRARAAAARYVDAHPEGLHRARLRRLLGEE